MSIIETLSTNVAEPAAERKLTAGRLVLLAGLAAIGALSTNIILPSFPSISAALNVPARDLGLTLSSSPSPSDSCSSARCPTATGGDGSCSEV